MRSKTTIIIAAIIFVIFLGTLCYFGVKSENRAKYQLWQNVEEESQTPQGNPEQKVFFND
ncbi:MAG: hypothetical protein HQ596_00795 [Candidatus Saganbacteria bacterium]|nr:hypothetical protein [Candidatus Saganbacteria bacterium]